MNTIDFAIPGAGVQVISPLSPLPASVNPVLIDGFSQPGYSGTPLIELSGSQAGLASGLTITGSDITIRGLDINGFLSGAGILISGSTATGNVIESNDIGTDPTGSQGLPNDFGVELIAGASDNLVGGSTAAAGNMIAFNTGQGVVVEGSTTTGNQITANQIFANDDRTGLQFDGSSYVSLPAGLIGGLGPEETIEASFRTTSGGVILSSESAAPGVYPYYGFNAILYVGTDGKLYGTTDEEYLINSDVVVNDGAWHSVALVFDETSGTQSLYLDGQLVGSGSGYFYGYPSDSYDQVGTGYTQYLPNARPGWYGFQGQIDDVQIWSVARSAAEVAQDASAPVSATAPGLVADYPFDEGQGPTAYDQTANHNDGTLAGFDGDQPTWLLGIGEAIDLGDDGITYNAASPRQGPNNLQNFPIIVRTADGTLQGWLRG